jgi:hypothetical protein
MHEFVTIFYFIRKNLILSGYLGNSHDYSKIKSQIIDLIWYDVEIWLVSMKWFVDSYEICYIKSELFDFGSLLSLK